MLVPTKRFWIVVGVGIPVAALGATTGTNLVIWAYNGLLLAAAVSSALLAPSADRIKISRKFDPVFSVRAPNVVNISVENDSDFPVEARIRDEPDGSFETTGNEQLLLLEPRETKVFQYKSIPPERGDYMFRGTYVRVICPLGLVERQYRISTSEEVRVYPNLLALEKFALLDQRGRLRDIGVRRSKIRGLGTEFESLRDYNLGDDYRKIDWKATARRGKLIVRQYEVERNQSLVIAIDAGRHMLGEINGITKLDSALDACLILAKAAFAKGDQVGLLTFRERVLQFIPPRKSKNQIGALIEAIHDMVAEPLESDQVSAFSYLARRWKKRSLIIVFTDASEPVRAEALRLGLNSLVKRHLVVIVQVDDPRMAEVLQRTPESAKDVYEKAAGLFIDSERTLAQPLLKSGRFQYLASEPQDLPKELVNFYYEIKERSLI